MAARVRRTDTGRVVRRQHGQSAVEYLGLIAGVAILVGVLLAAVPGIGQTVVAKIDGAIALVGGTGGGDGPGPVGAPPAGGGPAPPSSGGPPDAAPASADPEGFVDTDADGLTDAEDPVPGEGDIDGDGLSDGEEIALGSDPHNDDSDDDDVPDGEEYEQGTDPAQGVAPLTEENAWRPWERVGMTEDEWREFESAVLDEVNPGGLEGFLAGDPYWGVTLDENGELELMELQQASVGSGLAKGLARVLGSGGRAASLGQAASRAAARVPASARGPLARLGVVPGRTAARAPLPPARPGTAMGALDTLGRPTGAAATITRQTLGTGTRASSRIRPPGFQGGPANQARGHLIGRQLGGSGTDARNLVTLFQRPANSPVMRGFEGQVRTAVEAGQTVRYTATPIYRGAEAIPRAVTLSARGSRGFRLDVTVLNKGG